MAINKTRLTVLTVAAGLAVAACLDQGSALINNSHANQTAAPPAPLVSARGLPDFSTLVDTVGPAVVNISVTQMVRTTGGDDLDLNDPFFDFLRRHGFPVPQAPGGRGGPAQPETSKGVGSGFIVSDDGYVLTNAHVVADAKEVKVKLTDKREFKAKVVGLDKRTDVALIKLEAKGLPTVRIGNADKARVGEWVAAIGSPFGFENTVTAGIISAKARRLPDETYVPFLQTDVAINPGNSGGPLFNLNGEVIGINSQIYSRSGGFMGISFAIPIDVAMKVKDQLQKHGKVSRGRLGVGIQELTPDLAETFGLKDTKGALVAQVEKGSPAEKAGLQQGDVIHAVNGTAVQDAADLSRLVGEARPGQEVKLSLWRQGNRKEVSATLVEMPSDTPLAAKAPAAGQPSVAKLGVQVRPLSAVEQQQLGLNGGVRVESVEGPAARAGIQNGDVILGVNNRPVSDPSELAALVAQGGNRIALLVQRGGARLYVPIRLG